MTHQRPNQALQRIPTNSLGTQKQAVPQARDCHRCASVPVRKDPPWLRPGSLGIV
jgi:hypothetical protein